MIFTRTISIILSPRSSRSTRVVASPAMGKRKWETMYEHRRAKALAPKPRWGSFATLGTERPYAPKLKRETQSQFRFGVRLIASMMATSSERFDSSRNSRNSAALRRRSGSFPNWPIA